MANTANGTVLTTDFNVSPYYDDYNDSKQFYRILYKPGYAVQARELTQMQTIIQKQIERFGKHIFKDGSIVLPGEFSIETDLDYVKIKDNDNANNAISVSDLLGTTLTGATNNIKASIVNVLDGTDTSANTKTLYLRYQSGSTVNTDIKVFQSSEILVSNTGISAVANSSSATGKAARFLIREGVIFAKQHFVYFPTQSIVISRYTSDANCRVGFNIDEQIISSAQDASLLDPALEASNYAAPGADRLKLVPTLEVRNIDDDTAGPDFVELFTIRNGIVVEKYERPVYNILQDEMAKRTYDESGDYYVRGLTVRVREDLDTGTNDGLSNTGNSQLLAVGVEPGLAYVKGYEIEKLVTDYIQIDKANFYQNALSQIGTSTMGSYVIINELSGSFVADKGSKISLYDTAAKAVTNRTFSNTPSGNVIGTAYITAVEYNTGTLGTANGSMAVYLHDIRMLGSNSFSSSKTIFLNNGSSRANVVGDLVLNGNNAVLNDVSQSTLLYPVGSLATKTVRNSLGQPSFTFNFLRSQDVTITGSTGILSYTLATSGSPDNEEFPYGTTNLGDSDKREIFLTLNQDINVSSALSGTANSNTGGGFNVYLTGTGTNFTRLNVGDRIRLSGNAETFVIASIISDLSLTTAQNLPQNLTGNTITKIYKKGDFIDLTGKGVAAGTERTVSTTPTALTIDLKETFPTDISATITTQAVRKGAAAQEIQKSLVPSIFVKINCANSISGTTGPYSLGIPDVYQIRSIRRKSNDYPANTADGTEVKSQFVFDNGQKDSFYDHATITPTTPLQTTDRLLVELDYFNPVYTSGRGYFTYDSYPVNDSVTSNTTIRTENIPIFTSPRSKLIYDLRNYIDIRPIKSATANTIAVSVVGASVNPALSDGYNFETNGMRLFAPATQFTYSFSYYLPRRDLIVMDKSGFVTNIKGTPSAFPITPTTPENSMSLASIFIPPYPSLAPNYGKKIGRTDQACVVKKLSNIRFTMRDIGLLKQRIENVEYYASLSLLEKEAAEMKILDENGLERFKNGIFVDTFSNHALGDTRNPNYRIVVDPAEKTIRPYYTMNSIGYDFVLSSNTNIRKTGDLLTMNYTEVPFQEQNRVTSFRNVELTSYRFLGEVFVKPDVDVWVDTEYAPDEQITVGGDLPTQNTTTTESLGVEWGEWNTTWNSWQNQIVGYEAYNSNGKLVGSYQTLAQAQKPFDNDYGFILATANTQVIAGTGTATGIQNSNYTKVTNVVVNGRFYSTYQLSRGDGLIYAITAGGQTGISTRTGSETFATTTTEATETSEQIGTKVLDVGLIPYIRPQSLKMHIRGLKPSTQVYAFFDNEAMSEYAREITSQEYVNPNLILIGDGTNAFGSDLITDQNGELYVELRLTATKRFRVGTKEVVFTDSPTNSVDASTKAIGFFVAHGLVQQKQNTILTTRNYTTTTTYTTVSVTDSKNVANTTSGKTFVGFVDDASCSAYSFIPQVPLGEEGIFMTSVDLFFKDKHPTYGIWVEIREMDTAGGITRNQVPFSEVWLTPADMSVSDDASLATNIKFPSPVFLYGDTQYAFVIHTVAINPDTYIWVARLGETDIKTGNQYTSRPLSGTFYTTNNNLNWNIVDDLDLYIKFYRAQFSTGTGTAHIGNKQMEQIALSNGSSYLTSLGQPFVGRYRMTLSGNTSNIAVGDYLIGANSGANAAVLAASGSLFTVSNTRFLSGETLTIYDANVVARGTNTSIISSIDSASGILRRYKDRGSTDRAIAEFESSNGKFLINDVMTGLDTGNTFTVTGIKNMRYAVADFEPSFLRFNKTGIEFEMKTAANASPYTMSDFISIKDNENIYFTSERAILSRTNEVAAGQVSNNVKITMTSTSQYVSPVVDMARTHTIYVDNLINANTYKEDATGVTLVLSGNTANINISDVLIGGTSGTNTTVTFVSGNNITIVPSVNVNTKFAIAETLTIYDANVVSKTLTSNVINVIYNNNKPGGALINKYISVPITLAEGQDAEDLIVMLTSYRPPGTDVKVYVKILNGEDSQAFDYLPWIELETSEDAPFSSISNINDFIEYTYRFPVAQRSGPNFEVQYTNPDGIKFTGFKYYAIKIGLLGENAAVVPRVGDLRTIAVQI